MAMRHTWKIGKCLAWVGRERIASRKTFLGCTYVPGRVRHTTDDIGQVAVQKEVEIRERSWNRIVWLFCRDSTLSGGRHSRGYGGCDQFWDGSGSGSIGFIRCFIKADSIVTLRTARAPSSVLSWVSSPAPTMSAITSPLTASGSRTSAFDTTVVITSTRSPCFCIPLCTSHRANAGSGSWDRWHLV